MRDDGLEDHVRIIAELCRRMHAREIVLIVVIGLRLVGDLLFIQNAHDIRFLFFLCHSLPRFIGQPGTQRHQLPDA